MSDRRKFLGNLFKGAAGAAVVGSAASTAEAKVVTKTEVKEETKEEILERALEKAKNGIDMTDVEAMIYTTELLLRMDQSAKKLGNCAKNVDWDCSIYVEGIELFADASINMNNMAKIHPLVKWNFAAYSNKNPDFKLYWWK